MKKRFLALLTALLCLICVSAAQADFLSVMDVVEFGDSEETTLAKLAD